jgi:hypothetical protein
VMTKITFNLRSLPVELSVASETFKVYPFTPSVQRCTRCQRLNHTLKQCKAKHLVCSRCGGTHSRRDCTSSVTKCVNCGGSHSSAFRDCPRKQFLRRALRLKSLHYMSLKEALDRIRGQSYSSHPSAVGRRLYSEAVRDGPESRKVDSSVQAAPPPYRTTDIQTCDAATQLTAAHVMDCFSSKSTGLCFTEFLIKIFMPVVTALATTSKIRDSAALVFETAFGTVPHLSAYDSYLLQVLQEDFSRTWVYNPAFPCFSTRHTGIPALSRSYSTSAIHDHMKSPSLILGSSLPRASISSPMLADAE